MESDQPITAQNICNQFGVDSQPISKLETFTFKPKGLSIPFNLSPGLFEPTLEHPMKALMMKKRMADLGTGEPPLTPDEQALYDAWYARIEAEADENDDEE